MPDQIKIDMHSELLKAWEFALESKNINSAARIDLQHYDTLVKPNEDYIMWDKWQADTFSTRKKIQIEYQKILKTNLIKSGNKFLIVHHNYSGLANETQLARNINFIKEKFRDLEFEVAYLFAGNLSQQKAATKLYNLPETSIYFLQSKSYPDAGNRLNWLVNNKKYSSVIYPSIFFMAFWMSLFVNHCNQKFLQMKYFPRQVGRISTWACGRKNSEIHFNNLEDKFIQLSVLNLKISDDQYTENQVKIVNDNAKKINFGSISRPEKITDSDYNKLILELIESNPKIMYYYTGKEEKCQAIPEKIRQHPQTLSLGWVEPEKVINDFDIYLEPFPWGGGDMTLLALQMGRPYLILDTPQNRTVGIYNFIEYLSKDQDTILNFSFCKDLNTLKNRFSLLIKDSTLRERLGKAWASAINDYRPNDIEEWIKFLTN